MVKVGLVWSSLVWQLKTSWPGSDAALDARAGEHRAEAGQLDRQLDSGRAALQQLLELLAEHARWRLAAAGERAVFGRVLGFDEDRLRDAGVEQSRAGGRRESGYRSQGDKGGAGIHTSV